MPWTPKDAHASTKKATTPKLERQWADISNSVLLRTGDEGAAKRIANGVIKREAAKKK
jgi:hypothetical protein